MFGHEAGSFTGAAKTRHGRFEEADGGTLFLDELATLSSPAQDRLLRAVEYGEITRIGASKPVQVDVRIVAATNEHLPRLVDQGRFRADLLDRLSFEVVTLPPLRVRKGDIPLLAEHFGRRMAVELEWANWPGFSDAAQSAARKLRLAGQCPRIAQRRRARRLSPRGSRTRRSPHIQFDPFQSPWVLGDEGAAPRLHRRSTAPDAAPAAAPPPAATDDLRGAVNSYEKALLEEALGRHRFNQRATAAALGLSYDQLRHAMKRHKLQDSAPPNRAR